MESLKLTLRCVLRRPDLDGSIGRVDRFEIDAYARTHDLDSGSHDLGIGWKDGVVGHAKIGADLESPAGFAFKTGTPIISNHLEQEKRFRTPKLLMEHGVRRAINVLILLDGQKFGVLEVDSPEVDRFTDADLAFLQGFAALLGFAIVRQRTEAKLNEALAYKDALNAEISHRVKNSLSIVGSLLRMQSRTAANPELRDALADAQRRVETIASVHDRLWRTNEMKTVRLEEYFKELCGQFQAASENVDLKCDVAAVAMLTEQAATLGLLANELVTNAFKYAYPGKTGEVWLSLQPASRAEHFRLMVTDRGQGLSSDSDRVRDGSLGMKLVSQLSQQLGGEPEWQDAHPGTRFVLDFPARQAGLN